MLTRLWTVWRRLRRWNTRRRTDRDIRQLADIAARRQALDVIARAAFDRAWQSQRNQPPPIVPRVGPRGNGHPQQAERRCRTFGPARSPPRACCTNDAVIVTACDGVTDTVVCGVCRTRFQRPCPDGPIVAPFLD
jgi:hypothetical protein